MSLRLRALLYQPLPLCLKRSSHSRRTCSYTGGVNHLETEMIDSQLGLVQLQIYIGLHFFIVKLLGFLNFYYLHSYALPLQHHFFHKILFNSVNIS